MTILDSLMTQGMRTMDAIAGETFRLREVDRIGNVTDIATERELDSKGGWRAVRRCTIVYSLGNGTISPAVNVGETVWARGVKLKVERPVLDASSLTLECVDFTG